MHKTQSELNTSYSQKHESQDLGKCSIYVENKEVEIDDLYHPFLTSHSIIP